MVFERECQTGKDSCNIDKVQAVRTKVLEALCLIPFVSHLQSVYTCCQNCNAIFSPLTLSIGAAIATV
jgi:hypothetical protein